MEHSAELLKSFADRIARTAISEDAAQIARLLLVSGFLGGPSDLVLDQSSTNTTSDQNRENNPLATLPIADRVGIWELTKESGENYFVRCEELFNEWHFWANVERIEPKGAKRRIVLIGESVARGMLYDPLFTPAMVLETILQSQFGKGEIEVVDLARRNLEFTVKELAISALALDPDLVIMFAGNNWGVSFPDPLEIIQMDAVLHRQGIAGVKRLAEAQVARNAGGLVNDVAAIYESKNVPLVWIIPEFNLHDWREPITYAPYLLNGLNREWIAIYEEAQRALDNEDFSRAAELAEKMVEIDGGVCVTGFYILAECSQQRQDLEATRRYLELARDAVIWDTSRVMAPRSHSVVQEVLRNETSRYKNQLVDMPRLLKEYLKGGIPGRRLFLDYCHMSAEGIRIAMAAAASCVLRALKDVDVPWYSLMEECVSPTREVEAEASFLAAIHNAHWSQPYETVHYYCLQSLHLSSHITQGMINYIDIQSRRITPLLICQSAEQIVKSGSPLMSRYLFPNGPQLLDRVLMDAIVDALRKVGIDAREQLDQIRRDEHTVAAGDINLLDYYYCSSADQPQEVEWARPRPDEPIPFKEAHYYKAYGPYSRFVFVGEAGRSLQLCLTCRLPKFARSEGTAVAEVNGERLAQIVIDRKWATWEIGVAGELVRDGMNEIVVRWPIHELASDEVFEDVMENMFKGKIPDFYYIFGEIHSFTVSDGRKTPATI
jgi:hypothetical protein